MLSRISSAGPELGLRPYLLTAALPILYLIHFGRTYKILNYPFTTDFSVKKILVKQYYTCAKDCRIVSLMWESKIADFHCSSSKLAQRNGLGIGPLLVAELA